MVRLKEIRKARGMSQTELAEKVRHADPGATQAMISILESADLYPGTKLRNALCEALEVEDFRRRVP